MSQHTVSKILAAAVALSLLSATAHAKSEPKKATKEQKVGMFGGAAFGAVAGGPIGAVIGFVVGGITGGSIGDAKAAKNESAQIEKQLADARSEFSKLAEAKQAEQNAIVEQLAKRMRADVLFRTANAELDGASTQKLNELGSVLGAYPALVVEIDGFADPRGTSDSNDELSQQRASAVRAALIVGGAQPDQIKLTAHGEKLSTAGKDDLEAYAWERRVSLSVLPSANASQVAAAK